MEHATSFMTSIRVANIDKQYMFSTVTKLLGNPIVSLFRLEIHLKNALPSKQSEYIRILNPNAPETRVVDPGSDYLDLSLDPTVFDQMKFGLPILPVNILSFVAKFFSE